MSLQDTDPIAWAGRESGLARHIHEQSESCLKAYRVNPTLVLEHANIERATAQGGYGRRQIYELVQNGADALMSAPGGKIHVLLTESALYCANEGAAIDTDGVTALLSSHISLKRGNEIGRFGLGFKSVLGVTGRPEFYSRTGSFEFDADWAAELIRQIHPESERYPILRLAQLVDPAEARHRDPVLADFMAWATTVVKLPRDPTSSRWLSDDIRDFPPEFLLFSPHVGALILQDRTTGLRRELHIQRDRGFLRLIEGDRASSWRVFPMNHVPSAAARKDAGELADRESLPIIWAVPLGGRVGRGRFWAFFPTEYFTTLSGILNAPWKTNEDRQNLLTGLFNQELLDAAASLVVDSLDQLVDKSDPGRYLDLIPARGREAPNAADEYLTDAVYSIAKDRPSIPDQGGRLQPPELMHLHPDGATREALQMWASSPTRPLDWCHPSVETRERRPRVERLLAAVGRSASSWSVWLGQLVHANDPEGSIAALRVASRVLDQLTPEQRRDLDRAQIVLTAEGQLVSPKPGQVFIPGDYHSSLPLTFVHPDVSADPAALQALERFGITSVDPIHEFEALLKAASWEWVEERWALFWRLARRTRSRALEVLTSNRFAERVRVRTLAGGFRPLHSVLLPGPIVPEDGSRDREVTIDTTYHAEDMELLRALGAAAVPSVDRDPQSEPWFNDYREWAIERFLSALPPSSQHPQHGYLAFRPAVTIGPLEVVRHMTEEGRLRFTELLLQQDPNLDLWRMQHSTRPDVYPSVSIQAPQGWLLASEGRIATSRGVRAVRRCVGPAFAEWRSLLPVADLPAPSEVRLGRPTSFEELDSELWQEALDNTVLIDDDLVLGRFYAIAAQFVAAPAVIRCRTGLAHHEQPPANVTVVTTRREVQALIPQAVPTILVANAEDANRLTQRWGLRPAESAIQTQVYAVPIAAETPLIDEFPGLRWILDETNARLLLVRCSILRLETLTETGKTAEDRDFQVVEDRVYWRGQRDVDLLRAVRNELKLELSELDIEQILENKADQARRDRIVDIRQRPSVEARVAAAIGGAKIRPRLPSSLLGTVQQLHGAIDEDLLARLALAVYGVDTLRAFRAELEEDGLQPPTVWAGSSSARMFVRDLGFPPEFAGFEQGKRDPLLEVDGPPLLPPLHDFQAVIAGRVRQLLHSDNGNRAILSLPTGAGKTRVAVQAVIEEMRERSILGPILWVAQSDELCEQAVQSWSYVWRALGAREPLSISRLWATNEALPLDTPMHIVVATIDKLQGCIQKPEYGWLSKATCLIVDEAHESTEKSYTTLLEWLGLDRGRRGCPLIGLTATPYRGTSEAETLRLVRRYGDHRLDQDVLGEDPYATLQEMGVLARVKHKVLEGSSVELTVTELEQLRRTRLLPASVEDRLGADPDRNRMLLSSILRLPAAWTALLFATSVDHAQTMAALLTLAGVPAAAVSSSTDAGARRHYIEQFRAGSIRVLTNYAVLTQGFDAPAVHAIYVARPTFSPNLYQQMIGRGLRGPRNLGTDECLIVNVRDNVRQYGEELAFRQFEHLWTPYAESV